MTQACEASQAIETNLGAWFGAWFGTLAQAGRDKVTLVASSSVRAFGAWAEQLLAESNGKEGKGLIPILYEPLGLPQVYAVLQAFLEQGRAGDYVTFQAYLPPPITVYHTEQLNPTLTLAVRTTAEIHTVLLSMCARIRDKYGLAATFNYGPQYLHTTGQLHKGDAGHGLFIQLTADPPQDMPIPAEADALSPLISFGALQAAQALEDRRALEVAGRRTVRFHFRSHVVEQLTQLNQALL